MFDVLPKLILFYHPSFANYGHIWTSYSLYGGTGWSGNQKTWKVIVENTTVSWYIQYGKEISAEGQFNIKNNNYYYIYFE